VTTTAHRPRATAARPPDDDLLARLAGMPAWLGRAATGLGDAKLRQAPEGELAFVEQAWHLADLEREGFGERLRRLRDEDSPFLPDFDGARLVRERAYRTRAFAEGLAAFAAARARNLDLLRGLPAAAWSRSGTQEGVGPVRLADLPGLMDEHDASHRAEVEALLAFLAR
jgi:hypothetical protein